jgi:hypothetical protein
VEVSPWMLASDPDAEQFVKNLRDEAQRDCGKSLNSDCLPLLLKELDRWYVRP